MVAMMKIIFGLLPFVTVVGTIVGALCQLAFLRNLESSYGIFFPEIRDWNNDEEAETLRIGHVKPEVISWSPRIIVLHNFLSMEECDYLRALARPRLEVSTVVDRKTGKGKKSNRRTSYGMFLSSAESVYPLVKAIEKRIAVYSQVPPENGSHLQPLRYEKEQFYKPHHDYFSDTFHIQRGSQRVATMLMYLNDNVQGGETYFPSVIVTSSRTFQAGSGECTCGGSVMKGLSVKPVKGAAVLFWSMGLDGELDPKSVHGGCEVLSGEKWSATKWMREKTAS
ncbi:Prolyl 4-hydroxylase 1 [Linum grandiflorum]